MLADDRAGARPSVDAAPYSRGGAVNRMTEVADVPEPAVPVDHCPLHLFGSPVQVCNTPDDEGRLAWLRRPPWPQDGSERKRVVPSPAPSALWLRQTTDLAATR